MSHRLMSGGPRRWAVFSSSEVNDIFDRGQSFFNLWYNYSLAFAIHRWQPFTLPKGICRALFTVHCSSSTLGIGPLLRARQFLTPASPFFHPR